MADTVPARSVYRYFDLADSFVQIVVTDAEALALAETPALDRAGYRRMVLEACMPSLEGDAPSALETLFPDDPLLVERVVHLALAVPRLCGSGGHEKDTESAVLDGMCQLRVPLGPGAQTSGGNSLRGSGPWVWDVLPSPGGVSNEKRCGPSLSRSE